MSYSFASRFWRRVVSKSESSHNSFSSFLSSHPELVAFSATVAVASFSFVDRELFVSVSCDEHVSSVSPPFDRDQSSSSSSSSISTPASLSTLRAARRMKDGMDPEAGDDFYYGLFPKRQLFRPELEYPLWNKNWDGLEPESTGNSEHDKSLARRIRKTGTTRHIILIRHGQYDETSKEDSKRILTPLGVYQAQLTGKRLRDMISGVAAAEGFEACKVVRMHVSDLTRAKQTAAIIASYLEGSGIESTPPNSDLNEGRPCHTIPAGGPANAKLIEITDSQHERIERAFQTYFHRHEHPLLLSYVNDASTEVDGGTITSTLPLSKDNENGGEQAESHEFEIIVGHANVIRYFLCRALQLPPEAWLRYCPFNCSLTYLTIRPTGSVSCRMLGDIGHLPYNASTFSQHHGFNW